MDGFLISVVDLETTGLEPGAKVVEAAAVDLLFRPDGSAMIADMRDALFNPGSPIPAGAMAVHHIRDHQVAHCPPFACSWQAVIGQPPGRPPVRAFAAHNAAFEQGFVLPAMTGDVPWICTWKCAMRAYPDAPGHSNQTLRYHLGLLFDETIAPLPHRALHDGIVTAVLLKHMLQDGYDVETLIAWSAEPAVYPTITFGKHRNSGWDQPPKDYLIWLRDRSDMEPDVKWNADRELQRRERDTYVQMALKAILKATSADDLRRWWKESAHHRFENHIDDGSPEYLALVTACASHIDNMGDEEKSQISA
ncbi:exonuclease domain-containing protein [Phreatobacter sp. HK31-P]